MMSRRVGLSLPTKITLVFFALAMVLSATTAIVLYAAASAQVDDDIRLRLRDCVSLAGGMVDTAAHQRIVDPEQYGDADYRALQASLQAIRDRAEDVYFAYTMRAGADGAIIFVGDAEESLEDAAMIGQVYDSPGEALGESFAGLDGPVVERDFYTDQWGTWLSGYAPLFDDAGRRVGVLGIDVSASTVQAYKRSLVARAAVILLLSIPITLALGVLFGRRIGRPILALSEAAEAIGEGKLATRVSVSRTDELGVLSRSVNEMALALETSRSELEASAAKYRSIFDNATEGIFRSTTDGRLLAANDATARIVGYGSAADLLGEVSDIAGRLYADRNRRKELLDALLSRGRVDGFRVQLRRRDGETVWVEMHAHLQKAEDSDMTVIEGMMLDITERLGREEAERKRAAAEEASVAKSSFLANMSHEIRTPLNAVMGLSDLLARTEMSEKQTTYVDKIRSSSRALLALINDILDFSKIEAGRLDLERVDFSLYEVMANLSEMFAHRAAEKEIELLVSIGEGTPSALTGDPTRLGQVLINLVGNALKFTDHGEVVVAVDVADTSGEPPAASPAEGPADETVALRFSVRDTGIGIPRDRTDTIFDSFTQADQSTTRHFGGTGLGLTISKQLVELMGGRIGVSSTEGVGSTFHFTAHFGLQPADRQFHGKPPRDLRGLRVLVVDDNATARSILRDIFHSFEMTADTAASGAEAIEAVRSVPAPYDLIIVDWKMPGMNGIEVARRLKQDHRATEVPVVCMVSAYGREDLMQEADHSFLDAFLHKPINQSLLFDTIMELFGRAEAVPSDRTRAVAGSPGTPDLSGVRVLLTEDNEINREVAREWLESAGMIVEQAFDGEQAVARVRDEPFDIVLMDIQMPKMDGLDATRAIRSDPRFTSLPIVAMTAHALKGDRERGMAAGMNDYVTKPIDPQLLFDTIARLVPRRPAPGQERSIDASLGAGVADAGGGERLSAARGGAEVRGDELRRDEARSDKRHSDELRRDDRENLTDAIRRLDLPGIDVDDGLYRANGNPRLFRSLMQTFARDFGDARSQADEWVGAGSWADLKRLVHSLKGVAGNIGARDLSVAAAEVEAALRAAEGGNSGARPQIAGEPSWAELWRRHGDVASGIAAVDWSGIDSVTNEAASRVATEEANPSAVADRIRRLLDDDLPAAREELEQHDEVLRAAFGTERIDRVSDYVASFDIESAIAELELDGPDDV